MIPLERALFDLGDKIVELIGKDQYGALKALGRDTSDQKSLVRLCINIHTEWGLLRDKEYRNIILNSLSVDDAKELALVLGLSYERTPYKVLNKRTGNMIGHTYHGDVIGGMANAAAVDVYIQRRCML